ncbi:hypothetical protein KC318_g4434 [Hortaea werneckii]|nr:hypothetical protein KC334_g8574 [Hortaea werneckii]KAI7014859.1 hypothetical protein KC355_g4532 [Hortaea werneckii]KAI7669783.1 hypothetical protein KC318_g4434 [Hortaea werneckii]
MASKHSYNGKGGGGGGGSGPPQKKQKKEDRHRGAKCNLCKGYGHIKKFCPFAPAPPPPATAPSSAGQRSNVERLLAECEQRPAPKRRMSV